ncbi:MAG: hypothetical protein JNN07_27140 [Verrucomicrobiales bacterium]|nr:hypothetical protein [Verrucomicrobiales bacterium]
MRKRVMRFLMIGVALLLAAIVSSIRPTEPLYQDQTVSFWLAALDRPEDRVAALAALDSIGSQAIPTLLGHLGQRQSRIRSGLLRLAPRVLFVQRAFGADRSASVRKQAVLGFERLGPRANSAIPQLLRFTNDADEGVRNDAWRALAGVVGDGIDRYLTTTRLAPGSEVSTEPLTKVGTEVTPNSQAIE